MQSSPFEARNLSFSDPCGVVKDRMMHEAVPEAQAEEEIKRSGGRLSVGLSRFWKECVA
jgi:hypothetical protein